MLAEVWSMMPGRVMKKQPPHQYRRRKFPTMSNPAMPGEAFKTLNDMNEDPEEVDVLYAGFKDE